MATPNSDGVYEFNFTLEWKLTMSQEHALRELTIMDYVPTNMAWEERENNQLRPCTENTTLVSSADGPEYFTKAETLFPGLVQHRGLHDRLVSINGESPGPSLVVPYGSDVLVRVTNNLLLDSVAVHFHGLDLQDVWYNGGVAYLQQCPIAVKTTYTYRFKADRPGTHWYHGEFPRHQANGLLGAIVVKKPNETLLYIDGKRYPLDREYVATLQDWPVTHSAEQEFNHEHHTNKWAYGFDRDQPKCLNPSTYFGQEDVEDVPVCTIVINQKGWFKTDDVLGRPSKLPLSTYRIRKNENVLLRLLHGGYIHGLKIRLEGHDVIPLVGDGAVFKPVAVNTLVMYPGERYNIYIKGLAVPERKVYRLIVETFELFGNPNDASQVHRPAYGLANIEYEDVEGEASDEVDFANSDCRGVDGGCKKVYRSTEFEEHFISVNPVTHVDGYAFSLPSELPYYKNGEWQSCLPTIAGRQEPCFYHKNFALGKIIQITFYNMGPATSPEAVKPVPIHMHHTHFYVLKMGYPSTTVDGKVTAFNTDLPCKDMTRGCLGLRWSNSSWFHGNVDGMNPKPTLRDTVIIPHGGYVVIRFRARNAGWWLAESQNFLQNANGTAFAFSVGTKGDMAPPPDGFPRDCGAFEPPSVKRTKRENYLQNM
ncbi:Protein F21D5.3 a [Aphelenchoides avenae]|nr:Protein F21D5.3 a [Aphelenchus avenae]